MQRLMARMSVMVIGFAVVLSGLAGLGTMMAPPAYAANQCEAGGLLGLPPWYRGLDMNDNCEIEIPNRSTAGFNTFIWTIVFNIVQALLMVVGYVCVIFIIIGGFRLLTAAGSSEHIKAGKNTIRNAIIGLVISIAAVAIVNIIAGAL